MRWFFFQVNNIHTPATETAATATNSKVQFFPQAWNYLQKNDSRVCVRVSLAHKHFFSRFQIAWIKKLCEKACIDSVICFVIDVECPKSEEEKKIAHFVYSLE